MYTDFDNTKVFFDTEFTGLHQGTTLISIGLVSECGKTFYAELTDYDKSQVNDWIKENVLKNLTLDAEKHSETKTALETGWCAENISIKGGADAVKDYLIAWFTQFKSVKMWGDCLSYDWVLFNKLLADYSKGHPKLPSNINYIPLDICTLFEALDIDPDINREHFLGKYDEWNASKKHNALHDAFIIKSCFERLSYLIKNRGL